MVIIKGFAEIQSQQSLHNDLTKEDGDVSLLWTNMNETCEKSLSVSAFNWKNTHDYLTINSTLGEPW